MEVIGLVAAIPGLIEITRRTISVIRAFIDQKSFVKQITELLDQLESIEKILQEILNRLKSSTIHHSNLDRLTTVTRNLKGELIALGHLFQPLTASPSRKTKVLNRARLLISSLEGKIKKYHERLGKAQSSLMLVIVARNEAIVEESLTISRSNLRLKLNDVLLPCGYNFIPQNLQGTCEWIWSHPIFCEWQKDPTPSSPVGHEYRMMCIHGPKGCGKSVLAASIVQKLKSQANFAVGFSFWAGSHNQQKLLAFLRTFLWHMIQHIPDDDLAQISAPLLESLPLTEKTLEDVILIAVKAIKSRVYCIIDGIDESVDDWARPDAGGLRLVLDLAKTHANLRIVLLGRDASMRSATSLTPLRIEVTEELIRPDINQLILHRLDSSLKIQDAATRQLVQGTLQESSKAMFLWVTLIFGELNRCQLPSEIVRALHRVPRDLDREYHRLFLCLQDRLGGTRNMPSLSMERAKCLLSWIIAAPEPLTYEELRCAFAISQCPDKEYEHYLLSEDSIMDSCGDFIRVSDGRYHMIHASIVEFLTRPIELWQYEDETIDYFRIDVLRSQSLMCLECINYFQRTDLGYPLADASVAMSHLNLPIFSCALKFAFSYLTRIYASEHHKRVWEYFEDFMRTPHFCSLVEYALLIFQYESAASSEQHAEITKFISWVIIKSDVDQLPITLSFLETRFKEELARREKTFGLDDDRFRTWKSVVDILIVPPEGGQTAVSGLHDVEDNSWVKDVEIVSGNHIDRPGHIMSVEVRRTAKHKAMLKIGDMVAARAPVIQALTIVVPRFTSIIPELLLPIPFLILLAVRETNQTREEQYWSNALKRLAGANNFLEAYCTIRLGMCRYCEDGRDETVEGLLNRCRQIAMNLPSSLHVDVLLCSTLFYLAVRLLDHGRFLEAQEIVSELQQRLSNGPTKGYVSTLLERKLCRPLFWDDWKAELLANIAKEYAWKWSDAYYVKALSIVDSNIQLYKNPGHGRVKSSITAHYARGEALYRQWHDHGGKVPCELAHKSEAACHVSLQLAKFPNLVKYIDEQWLVLEILCGLLYRQRRYREARELISSIPADFLPTTLNIHAVISVAATAACLGDLETGEAILERASLKVQDQQVSLFRSESKHIANLIAALIKVRPIVRLWLLVSLCYRHFKSKEISKASHERDCWYEYAKGARRYLNCCFHELWDLFYIRHLALVGNEEDDRGHTQFALRCEEFAFIYTQRHEHEAAAVVRRYLISYALQRSPLDSLQWSLHYLALSLHFKFRGEEALALSRFRLLQTEKHVPRRSKWLSYAHIGVACFKFGGDHERDGNPLSAEFFKLAIVSFTRAIDAGAPFTDTNLILTWLSASRSALQIQGVAMASPELTPLPQVYPDIRYRDGDPKHHSCPDLRARYIKEKRTQRTAYNLWRRQSIKPT